MTALWEVVHAARELALDKVEESAKELAAAQAKHEANMIHAWRLEVGPTLIAKRIGQSEAGVRGYLKRRLGDEYFTRS